MASFLAKSVGSAVSNAARLRNSSSRRLTSGPHTTEHREPEYHAPENHRHEEHGEHREREEHREHHEHREPPRVEELDEEKSETEPKHPHDENYEKHAAAAHAYHASRQSKRNKHRKSREFSSDGNFRVNNEANNTPWKKPGKLARYHAKLREHDSNIGSAVLAGFVPMSPIMLGIQLVLIAIITIMLVKVGGVTNYVYAVGGAYLLQGVFVASLSGAISQSANSAK